VKQHTNNETEPKPHPSSAAVNMVLALEYQQRTGRLPSWAVDPEQVDEASDEASDDAAWADIVLPAALCITYLFIFQTLILP